MRRSAPGTRIPSPCESFRCADRDLVSAVTNEKSWASFCRLSEFAHLEKDTRYATQPLRSANRASLLPEVNAVFQTRPGAYWLAAFEKLGIPAEPINTLDEIMGHSQLDLRNMLLDIEYPPGSGNVVRTAGMPWRAVAAPRGWARRGPPKSPPGLGEHTQDVLRELGLLQSAAQHDR